MCLPRSFTAMGRDGCRRSRSTARVHSATAGVNVSSGMVLRSFPTRYTATGNGSTSLSILLPDARSAISRSYCACRFIQVWALDPNRPLQPQRRVRGYRAPAGADFVDPPLWHPHGLCHAIAGETQGLDQVLEQHRARMHRRKPPASRDVAEVRAPECLTLDTHFHLLVIVDELESQASLSFQRKQIRH